MMQITMHATSQPEHPPCRNGPVLEPDDSTGRWCKRNAARAQGPYHGNEHPFFRTHWQG